MESPPPAEGTSVPGPAPEAGPESSPAAPLAGEPPRRVGKGPSPQRRRRDADAVGGSRSLRWVLLAVALLAGATFLFRGAVYRSIARGEGGTAAWAAHRLLEMRDPAAFDIYVLQLGIDGDQRTAFASIVPELAGRDAFAPGEDLDAPAPPEVPEAQVEHRAILRELLERPGATARRGGLYALMMLRDRPWTRDEEMLLAVAARLSDEDVVARRFAALVLAGGPPPDAALPLLAVAARPPEPDPRVRRFAARALGRSAHASARAALFAVLEDPDQEVRDEASLGLVQSDQEVSLAALGELLARSPTGTRAGVVQAIARSGSPEATALLLEVVQGPDAIARVAAVDGLAAREGVDVRAALVHALGDDTPTVRVAATRALRGRADAREVALPALLAALVRAEETGSGWNELLEHHLTLKALTGQEVAPPTPERATWPTAVAGWRQVVEAGR